MNIGLLVQGSPLDGQACYHALRFAEAAVRRGHTIYRVFFYKEAVLIADGASDSSFQNLWIKFAKEHNVPLNLCVGASERRRVESLSIDQNVFEFVGLGQFVDTMYHCDRVVTFNT